MVLVVTFVFIVLRVVGDPMAAFLGENADADEIVYYTEKWGLDRPLGVQYVTYFRAVLQGDLGVSFATSEPALQVVLERVPATLQLGLVSLVVSLALGVPLGIWTAMRRGTWIDRTVMTFAVFGFSMPNFFLGILLILLFSLHLQMLPSFGNDSVAHLIMPAATLSLSAAGSIARFARSSMLEVMNSPYMRTAKAKGNPVGRRFVRHALPNAAIPLVTVVGFRLGDLIAGAIIVETVFAWPGIGRLLVEAVASRDLPVVQTIVLMTAATMVTANLTIDILYGWLDPRVRLSRGHAR